MLETLNNDLVVSVADKRFLDDMFEHLERTFEAKNWGNMNG